MATREPPPTGAYAALPQGRISGGRRAAASVASRPPPAETRGLVPAGEAAGIDAFLLCYNSERLSNQPFQVLRKRTEQALRVGVVGEELDDVAALQCCQ